MNDENQPWNANRPKQTSSPATYTSLPSAYYQSLIQDFQSLDIAGIDNDRAIDIPLSEVYIRLRVIAGEESATDSQALESGTIDIHAALGNYPRLAIVGDPGSGKSTFLKFIAPILAQSEHDDDPALASMKLNLTSPLPIPFFVSLWDLADFIQQQDQAGDNSISEFIIRQLSDNGIALSLDSLTAMLDAGSCCLLFDGLDEVPTEHGRDRISRLVEKFVDSYDKNRYVVTCWVRGYTGGAILKAHFEVVSVF